MADHDPLLVTREGPVVRATMNRPERRNALSTAMGAAWDALLAELAADATARVLVIGGAGGHFCAGLDLTEVASDETPEQKLARQTVRNRRTGQRFADISALPQVVIAAVEGSCHAGGLGFACAADIAVATATARFAAPEVRRGLVPAQILPWLARRAGRTAVTRLVLEAGVIDAAEAARIGLMHQVVVDATALERQVQATIAAVLEGRHGRWRRPRGCWPRSARSRRRAMPKPAPPPSPAPPPAPRRRKGSRPSRRSGSRTGWGNTRLMTS
ncbi:enoyl-CoA hydratase/isomerase family protein [Siccirubricoccus deserti]